MLPACPPAFPARLHHARPALHAHTGPDASPFTPTPLITSCFTSTYSRSPSHPATYTPSRTLHNPAACPPLDSSVPEALPPNPDSSLVNLLYAHHYTPMFYQQEGSDVQRLGLRPLLVPQRSTHPLAGIWRGTYGSHGYEVIRLEVGTWGWWWHCWQH